MAAPPPDQQGQLSPDGMWRWDGQRWVPAMVAPRRSRAWIWWLAGALTVSLLLLLAGAGYGVYSLASKFQGGGFSCLPADFPSYPGATVASEATVVNPPGIHSGDTKQCRMTLLSSDDVTTVGPYYQSHLASGDWTVVSTTYSDGTIHFQRSSRPQMIGTVQLLHLGQRTEIRIVLNS